MHKHMSWQVVRLEECRLVYAAAMGASLSHTDGASSVSVA